MTEQLKPWRNGVLAVAQMIERKADDYAAEFGSYDPVTGATEFSAPRGDYWEGLVELADEVRAMIVHVPPADAQAGQQEPVGYCSPDSLRRLKLGQVSGMMVYTDGRDLPATVALYTTPQPGPDVSALVEALEWCQSWFEKHSPTSTVDGFLPIVHPMLTSIRNALAAHRQSQQGARHDA